MSDSESSCFGKSDSSSSSSSSSVLLAKTRRKISLPWFKPCRLVREGSLVSSGASRPTLTRQATLDSPRSLKAKKGLSKTKKGRWGFGEQGCLETAWVIEDFTGSVPCDLNVTRGQQVEVLPDPPGPQPNDRDGLGWIFVRLVHAHDKEGFVPAVTLRLQTKILPKQDLDSSDTICESQSGTGGSSPITKRKGFSSRKWLPQPLRKLSQGKVSNPDQAVSLLSASGSLRSTTRPEDSLLSPHRKTNFSDRRHKPTDASTMGNKSSQSQSEEESEGGASSHPRVPSLTPHTATTSSASLNSDRDPSDDVESSSFEIPKMEIFSHPMSQANTAVSQGKTPAQARSRGIPTPPLGGDPKSVDGSTADMANELENIVKEKMEQHECNDRRSSSPSIAPSIEPSKLFQNLSLNMDDSSSPVLQHSLDSSHDLSEFHSSKESTPNKDPEDRVERGLKLRHYVLKELVDTERVYVVDLEGIVMGYLGMMRDPESEIRMPDDLRDGKDKIVFGNIEAIYEWHRDHFLKNMEEFLEHPENIGPVFRRSEKKFHMYVKYCQNKPKSEYIVSEYLEYFEELRQKLGHKLSLQDLLIKPIQRLMKYQLLLRELLKHTERSALKDHLPGIRYALEIMTVVPKQADAMMNVGRLEGFVGKIMAQGQLLLYGPLICTDPDPASTIISKKLIVFLFEQSIIFSECEGRKKQFLNDKYIYKQHFPINKIVLKEDSDPLKFLLKYCDQKDKIDMSFLCEGASQEDREEWVRLIRHLLAVQNDFLKALQSPISYQKEQTKNV